MVFLKTDTGEYRELLVPSIVSVGRGTTNDIRPQNQSVSKTHAQISVSYVPGTNKVEAWLEDLNSSYGTYAGETPLEIERVKGKIKLYFGFYMRFGHAPNYFQYLENIPANAEVMRPEIIVSPSKDFQKKVDAFASRQQDAPQQSQQSQQSQQQQQQQQQQFQSFGRSQQLPEMPQAGSSGVPMMSLNSSGFDQSSNMYNSGDNARFDSSGNYINPQQEQSRSRPNSGRQNMQHSRPNIDLPYDSHEDEDNPRNMQISVNYPTSNKHSPQHPVTIHIDPAAAGTGNYPRGRSSAADRYSNSPEAHSPGRSGDYDGGYSGDYGGKFGGGRSQSLLQEETRASRVNWLEESSGGHGTNDRVSFAESYAPEELDSPPRGQSYPRNNAIQAQHQGILAGDYDRVSSAANASARSAASDKASANAKQSKPKSVSENISELNKLARRSVGQQSNKVGKSSSAEDSAMHSRYYQQNQRHVQDSASLPRGILKPSKQADFQARVGDNGVIMDAVLPSKAELVRRSWPEELLLPSSELIAGFVDLLLAQESGTTEKEHALYKDIYLGKAKDKNSKNALPPGQDGANADLSKAPILAFLKMNPVKCELPIVLPDAVMSEAVAETILESDSTATGLIGSAIRELNNLLRQCLLGAQIDGSVMETSVDFDHALQGVMTSLLKHAIAQLMCAQQSNVIVALENAKNKPAMDIHSNVGLLIQQSIDSLTRVNAFMSGTYLQEETSMLRPNNIYEIGALALSAILNKLDACNVTVWSIGQRADEVTMEHVVNKSAGFLKASLSLELEELRKLKKDSDLTPLVDRIRQQETNILERKILRFHKVFDIILGFNMRSAFWEWRANARALKRHELQLMDLTDRCATNSKRQFFKVWLKNYRTTHAFKKALRRFGRIIGWKGCNQMRKYMHRWRSLVERSKQYNESGVEIARLRSELCNLKASLHDLTNKDEIAASLAAEKALNRELASMNQELRLTMQQQQEKLLEIGGAPSGKRKDLVYHYLLGKEEELAETRRENKFLHSELEHLRILAARRLQPAPKGRVLPPAPAVKPGPAGYRPVSLLRDDGPLNQPLGSRTSGAAAGNRDLPSRTNSAPSAAPRMQQQQQLRYDPSRNKTVADKPNSPAFMMSKDEAKVVILSEVRRLRESHTALQDSRNQLNNKMIEETNRNVQLTMATQSLQSRLTAIERSANALRQILRQKFGDQGVLHMMESLEGLGAGSNALLEMPVSGTAEVVSADVQERLPYSYEAKHPESPRAVTGVVSAGRSAAPGAQSAAQGGSYYLERESGGGGYGAQYGGASSKGRAGAGSESDGMANPYGKAVENAMYGKR